jgi:DNA-binding NarL/FixJ family response regulator
MIKVTIFEDNNGLRNGLFQLINGTEGFSCVGAFPDCENLIRKVEQSLPDVILMDIEMPGMTGIEAVKIIREKFPTIKVLMQTIFEDDNKIFNSICAGASGYMIKNTSPARMLDCIKEIYDGGSPMTPSIANKVLQMLKEKSGAGETENFNLTSREKEVLSCLVRGMSYKLIADACFISIETVRGHIKNIYEKLQVHSKSEAVAKAIKGRIV